LGRGVCLLGGCLGGGGGSAAGGLGCCVWWPSGQQEGGAVRWARGGGPGVAGEGGDEGGFEDCILWCVVAWWAAGLLARWLVLH
jgi:hypothetical protein